MQQKQTMEHFMTIQASKQSWWRAGFSGPLGQAVHGIAFKDMEEQLNGLPGTTVNVNGKWWMIERVIGYKKRGARCTVQVLLTSS